MEEQVNKWILVSANRYIVGFGLLLIMTAVVVVPDITRLTIRNITPLKYIASALITGNITLITVVVVINQLILSKELKSPGSLREEIEQTADFRKEALTDPKAPIKPADFMNQLLKQTQEHAQSLDRLIPDSANGAERLLTDLPVECQRVSDQLNSSSNTLTSVIVPFHSIDYAKYIQDCYQLQLNHKEEHHEELFTALDALSSDLSNLDIAEEYFTTAYMEEELATLSRVMASTGVVSVSMPIALLYQLTTYTEASPPMTKLFIITVCTVIIGLIPIALLISFILRIATVTHYLAAITPFKA